MNFFQKSLGVIALSITVQACTIEVSYKSVVSETQPSGNIDAVLVKGAKPGRTDGGSATSAERCVYYWKGDIDDQTDIATYKGSLWPYIFAKENNCKIVFDSSVPSNSRLREDGFVSFNSQNHLTIGGLPVYQYPLDGSLECLCNHPPYWTSLYDDGDGAAFNVNLPIDS